VVDNRPPQLLLASSSPRRRLLLAMLGVPFEVIAPNIDESSFAELPAMEAAVACASAKAAMALRLANARMTEPGPPPTPVLGVDTEVVHEGVSLGKPADDEAAWAMLRRLSGRQVEVVSGLALISAVRGEQTHASAVSRLQVAEVDDAAIEAYLGTGEHRDKAGGLAVQGAAKGFVTVIEGSRSNVYGLPLVETAALLAGVGIAVRQQRSGAL